MSRHGHRHYQIRAEFRDGCVMDLWIGADSLTDVRIRAPNIIRRTVPGALAFDWRGQVVFVDCVPAEERIK